MINMLDLGNTFSKKKKPVNQPIVDLGKYSFIVTRLFANASKFITLINFAGIIYLSGKDEPLFYALAVLGFFGIVIYSVIDFFLILPREQQYANQKNPFLVEMQNDIKDIKELINK